MPLDMASAACTPTPPIISSAENTKSRNSDPHAGGSTANDRSMIGSGVAGQTAVTSLVVTSIGRGVDELVEQLDITRINGLTHTRIKFARIYVLSQLVEERG